MLITALPRVCTGGPRVVVTPPALLLQVIGEPEMSVVAFRSSSKSFNIYKLNDLMTRKGWHLNALQVGRGACMVLSML